MSVSEYLEKCQYRNVSEWAIDSGYVYDQDTDLWTDEHGSLVDPYQQLLGAIESATQDEYERNAYRVTLALSLDVLASDERDAESIAYGELEKDGIPSWFIEALGLGAYVEAVDPATVSTWYPINEHQDGES